jgi:flap endonuclease-1
VKISEIVGESRKLPQIGQFAGKRIAIDAYNMLYQFLSSIRQEEGIPLMDQSGRTTSHLSGFFYRTAFLLENKIKPVYVFDGKPHELKTGTIKKRKEVREAAKNKAEDARDEGAAGEAKKFAQASSRIEPYMVPEIKEMLSHMGVPCVDAASDGEAQAAFMVNKGDVSTIASQDYDCFLYGAQSLLRNLTQQTKRQIRGKVIHVEMESYILDDVLAELKVTREQLVDIGILTGTDFNGGIRGVGQKTALKMIQTHGSIDAIYESKPEYADMLPLDLVDQVREIFLNPEITEDYAIEFGNVKTKEVIAFLCNEHQFSEDRIRARLQKLSEKEKQFSLDSFIAK